MKECNYPDHSGNRLLDESEFYSTTGNTCRACHYTRSLARQEKHQRETRERREALGITYDRQPEETREQHEAKLRAFEDRYRTLPPEARRLSFNSLRSESGEVGFGLPESSESEWIPDRGFASLIGLSNFLHHGKNQKSVRHVAVSGSSR